VQSDRHGVATILLHWVTAVLVAGAWFVGDWMTDLSFSPLKLKVYSWHKWTGILVFALLIVRVGVRIAVRFAPRTEMPSHPVNRLARGTHLLLYLLLALVPLSGWLYSSAAGFTTVWFGIWPIPDLVPKDAQLKDLFRSVHDALTSVLAALVVLHLLAALKHHFIDRDRILVRMVPGLKPRKPSDPSDFVD
jgi:cytochrome b561